MSTRFMIYLLLLAIIFFTGLFRFKMLTTPFIYLCVILGVTLTSETISGFLKRSGQDNIPVYHFFSCFQYAGTALVFFHLIKTEPIKRMVFISIIPVGLLSFLNSFYLQDIHTFPSNLLLLSYGIFLILALFLFKEMIDRPIGMNLFKQSKFWFATAYLFFPAAVFLSFGLQNYFKRHQLELSLLNDVIYFTNIIFYALLGIALLVDSKYSDLYDRE